MTKTEILELHWLYFNPVSATGRTSKLGQGSWISSTPARWQWWQLLLQSMFICACIYTCVHAQIYKCLWYLLVFTSSKATEQPQAFACLSHEQYLIPYVALDNTPLQTEHAGKSGPCGKFPIFVLNTRCHCFFKMSWLHISMREDTQKASEKLKIWAVITMSWSFSLLPSWRGSILKLGTFCLCS